MTQKFLIASNGGAAKPPNLKERGLVEGARDDLTAGKEQVLERMMRQLGSNGSFNLNLYARQLEPFRTSISKAEKDALGTLLADYTMDHLMRAQYRALEGLEKLGYLLESIDFAPDKEAVLKLRVLDAKVPRMHEVLSANETMAMVILKRYAPEADHAYLAVLRRFAVILEVSRKGSGNLSDLSDSNPSLAASFVRIHEAFAGRKLDYLRSTLSQATRRILEGIQTEDIFPSPEESKGLPSR